MKPMPIVLIIGFIHFICFASSEELQSFTIHVATRSSAGCAAENTVTVWFNQSVYQCGITPSSLDTDYSCDATASFIGCDRTTKRSVTKMRIENNDTDASSFSSVTITTDLGTYTISGICIDDTEAIGGTYNRTLLGENTLCDTGYSQYTEICIDPDEIHCSPAKQVIYFDTTSINTDIENAAWKNGQYGGAIAVECTTQQPTISPSQQPTTSPTTKSPTIDPTQQPTTSPTRKSPTVNPTLSPSSPPTSLTPTPAPVAAGVNITFSWKTPLSGFKIPDPYAMVTATIYVTVDDPDAQTVADIACKTCFIWQIMNKSAETSSWEDIVPVPESIQIINSFLGQGNKKQISSTLKINSIRKLQQSNCVEPLVAVEHILRPGNTDGYSLRLRVEFAKTNDAAVTFTDTSDERSVTTNSLPYGGTCSIVNIESKNPLDTIYFNCSGWTTNVTQPLKFNGIIGGVAMKNAPVTDLSLLSTRAPVGAFNITILIIDDLGAITCHDIAAVFKDISAALATQTVENITSKIADIVNTTNLGEDLSIVSAIASVTDALLESGEVTQEEAQSINTDVTSNVISTATIFNKKNKTANVTVSAAEITNVVATFVTLTSNPDTVDINEGGAGAQIVEVVEDVFDIMDDFIFVEANDSSEADNEELQSEVISFVDETLNLFVNLAQTLTPTDDDDHDTIDEEKDAQQNKLAQELADFDGVAVTTALSVAKLEETYSFTKEIVDDEGNVISSKKASGTKTDPKQYEEKGPLEQPSMKIGRQGMILPLGIGDEVAGAMDITVSVSTKNYFKPKNKSYKGESPTVTINLFKSGDSRRRLRRRRRRRLAAADSKVEYNASECFPYFIYIDVDNSSVVQKTNDDEWSLNERGLFPSCRYWNGALAQWNADGCFVYIISNVSVVCACSHLTTFQVSAEDFVPKANILTFDDLRDITPKNLMKYPVVWIVFVSFVVIFIIIGYLNPNKGNEGRSIIAYEDMIYHDVRKDKMEADYSGKQVHAFSVYTPNQNKIGQGLLAMSRGHVCQMCKLQWKLFLLALCNDHTLISVIQRAAGTNFSTRQRVACFFMYFATIMVASAIFYGVKQQTMGDITASFAMSLLSTAPVLLVKQLFMKAKPAVIKSAAKEDVDSDEIFDECADDELPRNSTRRQQIIGQLKMSKTMANTLSIVEKKKMTTHIRELNAALRKLQKNKSRAHRIALVEKIRVVLFNKLYPLPPWCKKLAWIILILWGVGCMIIAVEYGMQFDLRYRVHENWLGECWQNFQQLVIERNLSKQQMEELQAALDPYRADNFPGATTSSVAWLMSLVMSLILSLILWQPLTVYVTTWIKLWMFTWNVSMELGPGKMCALIKKVCCNKADDDALISLNKQLSGMIPQQQEHDVIVTTVVAHGERPLDLIGFIGNDVLFLDRLDHVELVVTAAGNKQPVMGDAENTEPIRNIRSEENEP